MTSHFYCRLKYKNSDFFLRAIQPLKENSGLLTGHYLNNSFINQRKYSTLLGQEEIEFLFRKVFLKSYNYNYNIL